MLLRKGNASQGHGKVSKWSWRTPRDKSVSYCRKLCVFISKYLTSTRGLQDSVTALFLTTNSFVSRYIAKYFLLPYRDHNKLRGKKSFTSKSMWIMVIHQADQHVGFFPPPSLKSWCFDWPEWPFSTCFEPSDHPPSSSHPACRACGFLVDLEGRG